MRARITTRAETPTVIPIAPVVHSRREHGRRRERGFRQETANNELAPSAGRTRMDGVEDVWAQQDDGRDADRRQAEPEPGPPVAPETGSMLLDDNRNGAGERRRSELSHEARLVRETIYRQPIVDI